ncbi:MAG TPA: bifunctional methylenetetrahydrofolate dehydrogenase/methenyltetrahydrofolate cyclohydrolase FolD [bacterium]|nr:bifunctional methylenetetrahydrofolate dehydrogenase/methenyltetrahydrofolate cyclohydrolase FolD [bacterium]
MAQILDGKKVAQELKDAIGEQVKTMDTKPGLAVVIVGDDPASHVYVNSKEKACAAAGFYSEKVELPAETTQEELIAVVDRLNADEKIHGILVQLPLPKNLNEEEVLLRINPAKDVDGFHPYNMGLLLGNKGALSDSLLVPCTPKGIMKLLAKTGIELKGKKAVIVGRSNLVGKPIALLLLYADASPMICHSRTTDLESQCREADILVAAVGRPKMVKADWVKEGAIVIDVGINRTDEGLVGDVDYEAVEPKAAWITPVPGGVGPMTIACLLENTLIAMRNQS